MMGIWVGLTNTGAIVRIAPVLSISKNLGTIEL